MSLKTDFIIKVLHVVSWIIFIGLCIETGGLTFNYVYSLFKPIIAKHSYMGLNLSEIYRENKITYTALFSFAIIISGLKAFIFYLIIEIFLKLDMVKPFSEKIATFISKMSYHAFSVGILSIIAHQFTQRYIHRGYDVDVIEKYWNDSAAFLMMAAILFIIAQIFQKGLELQSENELTV
jgi:Protein of unknown function (DUF2975)